MIVRDAGSHDESFSCRAHVILPTTESRSAWLTLRQVVDMAINDTIKNEFVFVATFGVARLTLQARKLCVETDRHERYL